MGEEGGGEANKYQKRGWYFHFVKIGLYGNSQKALSTSRGKIIYICTRTVSKNYSMKIKLFFALFVIFETSGRLIAQNTWTPMTSLPAVGRWTATGFAVAGKGYMYGGYDGSAAQNDMWQFDPIGNTWSQKANLPGSARFVAACCVVSGKAYIGTGAQNTSGALLNDWWEYDPAGNTWTAKTNYPGGLRGYTESFVIGTKGYVCTGLSYSPTTYHDDLWEYDPALDSWTQKANFAGGPRAEGIAFAHGNAGYFGMGKDGANTYTDIWKWDQATNTWSLTTNFPGQARVDPSVPYLCERVYFITGWLASQTATTKEVWRYDVPSNGWLQLANFPGTPTLDQGYFSIGTKGYICTGYDYSASPSSELWEFLPDCAGEGIYEGGYDPGTCTIYPNSFSSHATLEIKSVGPFRDMDLKIYDMAGSLVSRRKLDSKISILARGALVAGTYFFTVSDKEKVIGGGKFNIATAH